MYGEFNFVVCVCQFDLFSPADFHPAVLFDFNKFCFNIFLVKNICIAFVAYPDIFYRNLTILGRVSWRDPKRYLVRGASNPGLPRRRQENIYKVFVD